LGTPRTLSVRELNRALLARQLLLERRRLPPMAAVERLLALQAQVPRDPYVALWSRLEGFRASVLSDAVESRRAVRMTLLRATLHLVSARDALSLRPMFQPVVRRMFFGQRTFRDAAEGVDLDEVVEVFRARLEEQPGTRSDLSRAVAERWPDRDAENLAYAMYLLPTVQVTPRGLWGRSGRAAVTTLEHWLGAPRLEPHDGAGRTDLVRRYLSAFGPATPADFATWSGLAGMRDAFEELRPRLRSLRDERGRELFDVPRGPLPDPSTPAPVRFLPEYDNALLGYDDRSRVVPPGVPMWTAVGWGTVLVDGFVVARWSGVGGEIVVEPFRDLTRTERRAVTAEGSLLGRFLGGGAGVAIGETDPSPPNQRPGHQPNRN
jgi:hypothetical protein